MTWVLYVEISERLPVYWLKKAVSLHIHVHGYLTNSIGSIMIYRSFASFIIIIVVVVVSDNRRLGFRQVQAVTTARPT